MTPYTDDERKQAWRALYERFNELPVPSKEVWQLQAELTRLKKREREAAEYFDTVRDAILNERFQLAEEGCTGEQINSVLGILDDHAPEWLAEHQEEPC